MLKQEKRYDFKKDLLQIHKKDRRDLSIQARQNEFVISDDFVLVIPCACDVVMETAIRDFEDYLITSMQITARISYEKPDAPYLSISLNQDIEEAAGYMGYRLTVSQTGVTLEGYDSRGIAQGLYFLEDLMNLRKAPYLEFGVIKRKAMFTPRFAQSPLGMFAFTDECFAQMAHLGYDAIDLWIKDLNLTKTGDYIDMPLLCERAEKYGIKLYIELYASHSVSAGAPGAQAFYDQLYGKIFSACPKLHGVVLLGEAINYNSQDAEVGGAAHVDNIPTGNKRAGWWPCRDYPELVRIIQQSVCKYQPDADIVFCTYNWGATPEEKRLRLIEALPEGVSLMPTWEMFHTYNINGAVECMTDYSLRFEGPGEYFKSEAIAAKKRGIKLYANAQTAGRTWDFGVIPYEPMPYQWIKRYEAMIKAHEEWGLAGVWECIHYGFYPSFISDLEKWAFFTHEESLVEVLHCLLKRDFGEENLELVDKAMHIWSEAICHCPTDGEGQYGAFRIGPSYPLWLGDTRWLPEEGRIPAEYNAMWGNSIYTGAYTPYHSRFCSLPNVRIYANLAEIKEMKTLLLDGIQVLESIDAPNEKLLRLINLGKFMYRTCITGEHDRELYILKQRLTIAETKRESAELIDAMERLLLSEKKNVEQTIPLVQVDSRLGWEPSMEYMGDEKCLRWKLSQLDYSLNKTLTLYREANSL